MEAEGAVWLEEEVELCNKKKPQRHSFLQVENTLCVENISNTMVYTNNTITYDKCCIPYLFGYRPFIYYMSYNFLKLCSISYDI